MSIRESCVWWRLLSIDFGEICSIMFDYNITKEVGLVKIIFYRQIFSFYLDYCLGYIVNMGPLFHQSPIKISLTNLHQPTLLSPNPFPLFPISPLYFFSFPFVTHKFITHPNTVYLQFHIYCLNFHMLTVNSSYGFLGSLVIYGTKIDQINKWRNY